MVERYRQDDEWRNRMEQGARDDRSQERYASQGDWRNQQRPYRQDEQSSYGRSGQQSQQGYGQRGFDERRPQWQQEQRGGLHEHYGGIRGHGGFMGHGSPDERYGQQGGYGVDVYQDREHEIPTYGSGRGPYASLAGYGAYSGAGPDNYNVGPREHEGSWHGGDVHNPPNWGQRPSYGPYGGAPSQRDYGAYGAQGYGGEGGSGAQGYGGQGAYGRYGSESDYGTPGGYGGDRVYRQGGARHDTGGGAHYGALVSYGQGAYGGYGQGEMGRSSGQGGQSWGNWGQSGQPGRSQRRGPKNYQRSDERLQEEICERLMARWDLDTSEVSVQVSQGEVTLEGVVPERRMRHEIENLVDDCHGVKDIDNRIRVQSAYGSTSSGSSAEHQFSQSGSSRQSSSGQQSQASVTASQPGQDSSKDARMGSTAPSSAPARSASDIKKE
ncbi:MAG TPA: BON domain-containing protein [Burkholderiales bacterium]|nr:BON domain-containing protein [Burkholderiales bacterium]